MDEIQQFAKSAERMMVTTGLVAIDADNFFMQIAKALTLRQLLLNTFIVNELCINFPCIYCI